MLTARKGGDEAVSGMGNKLHRPSQTGRRFDLSTLRAVSWHTRVAVFAQATINPIFPRRCFVCGELIDAAGAPVQVVGASFRSLGRRTVSVAATPSNSRYVTARFALPA